MIPSTLPDYSPDHLEQRPIEEASTLPASWYASDAFHTFDLERIFYRHWVLVGPLSNITESGRVLPFQIGDAPLILVRNGDGQLNAFHNVCRHRGGPLATETSICSELRCAYHGWTYDLDGSLKTAPELGGIKDFDKVTFSLPEISVEVWRGLVFVSLNEQPLAFDSWVEGIDNADMLTGAQLEFSRRESYDIQCNWKVYVDNFLEGYHIPQVHPALNELLDYRSYQTILAPWHTRQHSPLTGKSGLYSADGGEAYYYFMHPATMLNILPDRLQTNQILPLGPRKCRVIFDYYYARGTAESVMDEDREVADIVQQEDITICEHVQRGLGSPSYVSGRYSAKWETGVHHFHALLREAYAKPDGA